MKKYFNEELLRVLAVMMMIAPNFHACKSGKERGEVKGEYGRIWGEEENAEYGRMV